MMLRLPKGREMTLKMRRILRFGFAFGVWSCLLGVSTAFAGLYPPENYGGQVEQRSQKALVFFDGQHEDLVLSTTYAVTEGEAPKSLAWVIPIPSAPERHVHDSVAGYARP